MIVLDAHQDIAYNAYCFGRDYRRPALETRRIESGSAVTAQNGVAMVGLPDALLGRVAVTFATLFVAPRTRRPAPWEKVYYDDAHEAYQIASAQMDYYERLADETDQVHLIRAETDLDVVLATWADGTDVGDHRAGLCILMENADPILEPKQFEEWHARGVRIVGPAWVGTRYCGGTGAPGPLTDLGRELLEVLADFNVVLDLSHMAEESFFEALDRYEGESIIASHSNPRRFRDSDRHLSDLMIRQLAERDGVMGVVMLGSFLTNTWDAARKLPFSIVADAIDYVCQLTGSAAHVGLGSDFDGGFGAESTPHDLDTVTDLWHIGGLLRARGYAEEDIAAILSGNMLRKLRPALR